MLLGVCAAAVNAKAQQESPKPTQHAQAMPLQFVQNLGQDATQAKYLAQGPGYSMRLYAGAAELGLARRQHDGRGQDHGRLEAPSAEKASPLRMDFLGARKDAALDANSPLPGVVSYFVGADQSRWLTNLPTYGQVRYRGIYPGVDLSFHSESARAAESKYGSKVEYDFELQPHARLDKVAIALKGAEKAELDGSGNLVLTVDNSKIRFLKPVAWQGSGRRPVEAAYKLIPARGNRPAKVSFEVAKYDPSESLVIDPVLDFATGLNLSSENAMTADSAGNTYLVGGDPSIGYAFDVLKFSAAGALVYTTVVAANTSGTYGYGFISGIGVNSRGDVLVAGGAAAGWPTTSSAYQTANGYDSGGYAYNAYLVELSSAGKIAYATYFGGSSSPSNYYDYATAIAVDSSGNAYITGSAGSSNFPATGGAYQSALPSSGGSHAAFVAKINPALSGTKSLVYSTLLGDETTSEYAIAVDSSGDAYVTGSAESYYNTFPLTSGAFAYTGIDSSNDQGVYVTKLNSTGTAVVYSAYLGYGYGEGIAVDGSGDAYVTGQVNTEDFPTTSGAYQTSYPGGFVTELNPAGSAEIYSTFLSGPSGVGYGSYVTPYTIALAPGCVSACPAYVAGVLYNYYSYDLPQINSIQTTPSNTNYYQGFLVGLNGAGSAATISTYLSGVSDYTETNDIGGAGQLSGSPSIGVDSSGNIYYAAQLNSGDYPLTGGGSASVFLDKIGPAAGGIVVAYPSSVDLGTTYVNTNSTVYNATPASFVLRNEGTQAVSLTSFTASSGIFSQTNTCGGTIPGGGQCTVTPSFTPTVSGAVSGTLTIGSTGTGSPTVVSLSGTAYDGGYLQVTPTTGFNFGNVAVGAASSFQALTIKNTGDQAITSFYLYNLPAGFNTLNNCPSTLNAGASCEIGIQFAPYQAGLVTGNFYVYNNFTGYSTIIPVSGTGVVNGDAGSLALSATAVNFNSEAIGVGANAQAVTVTNTGTVPVTVNPFTIALTSPTGSATDFADSNYLSNCGNLPYSMQPGQSCYFYVYFTPSVVGIETATLSIPTSAGAATVAMSGTGTADAQDLVFSPANYVFPDEVVGTGSSVQYFYVYNSGSVPVFFDRVYASQGDFDLNYQNCANTTLNPPTDPGVAPPSYCSVGVVFAPTATGNRTGTITFVDSSTGTTQTLTLSGTGIAAVGALDQSTSSLTFPALAIGTPSATQTVTFTNTGNSGVYVNSFSVTGDFAGTSYGNYCGSTVPCYVPPGYYFQATITFTPTSSTNPRKGTLTVNSSAGVFTVALSGTGETATQSVATTPSTSTTLNFGSVVSGSTSNYLPIYLHNTGTEPVTISSPPTVTGSFNYYQYYGGSCGYDVTTLQPGAECAAFLQFAPTTTGTLTGTLVFTDSAGTQTVKLTGTGVTAAPTTYFDDPYYAFPETWVGTGSNYGVYQYFYNETANPITIASVAVTGTGAAAFPNYPFSDNCTYSVVASGSDCYVQVYFAPTAAGYYAATLTLTDTSGKTYTTPLYGYSPAVVDDGYLSPNGLAFTSQTVNTPSTAQVIYLYDGGTTGISVGAATGTNLGPTSEFRLTTDNCSNTYQTSSCYMYVEFVPSAAGTRTGTLSFPVTYSDGTTATLTASLSGVGNANTNQAVLSPLGTQFTATVIGQTNSSYQTLKLSNQGTAPFVVGFLTGTNTAAGASATGDFTTSDSCSGAYVGGGSSCTVNVYFAPRAGAAGARNGSLTFPVTYLGATSPVNLTATYTGNAVATGGALQITPSSLQMGTWIEGTYSKEQTITLYNDGNTPVTFGNFSSAAPFYTTWTCGATLAPGSSCTATVLYEPSAIGSQTGTITLANNATGALQKVAVSGTGIAASQQLAFSQSTVAFGSVLEGTTSNAVTLSLVNRSSQTVTVSSVNLAGTNPADYTVVSNGCNSATLYGYETYNGTYSSCSISLEFSPLANTASTTPLTATITEFDSGTGSGRKATLTGTSTAPAPSAGLFPVSLAFGSQYENTQSSSQTFSVTNTGSSALKITSVATSSSTQFPITSNSCNGVTLAAGADCLVAVAFKPSSTGSIAGSITVTDNATGSPQTLPLSGTGVIPTASLSATTLTYAQQGVGSTSASQSVTLSNTGTGTLLITSVFLGGADAGDYALTNSCGSSLAAGASCKLGATFTPKATGTRTATITIDDNSGLVNGASQTISLTGTGIPVAATPTFSVASGTYASPQTVTLADTTTGATIYYTTNGTTPTTSSTKYAGTAITVSANETIEAIAVATGYAQSPVATATYAIQAATPKFSVASGTYASPQTLTLADTTTGATIYYTTNGTTPTTSSTKYAGTAITVSANETIEAIAVATGYAQSPVATATYAIEAATPTFSVTGGTYAAAQSVKLSDTTTGATIYYTTNGTTPTTSSTKYAGTAITVSANETIEAIAVATGYAQSPVATAKYIIQ
jgi:hypothetical protein